jgi:hypothetical protein
MVLLKEKLLEMQRGMEFLTNKESEYVELQQLAEEEAETICELEKENYKLKHALNNIDDKIALEKSKYIELAEYEAETICNLEKENYRLIDSLNTAEETIKKERENNKVLQETSKVNYSRNIKSIYGITFSNFNNFRQKRKYYKIAFMKPPHRLIRKTKHWMMYNIFSMKPETMF